MAPKTNYQAGDQSMLRQINLSAIMNYIRIEAPISRSKLAQKTGLNKATITSLVGELIQHQFIQKAGILSRRRNLSLSPKGDREGFGGFRGLMLEIYHELKGGEDGGGNERHRKQDNR